MGTPLTYKKLSKDQRLEPGVSDEHIALIGLVTEQWPRLEVALETLIWHFLKLDPDDGRIVTANMDARTKIRMIRALAKRHIKARHIKTQLSELLLTIEKVLAKERNWITHGIWSTIMPDGLPTASSLREELDPGYVGSQGFPPERMKNLVTSINNAAHLIAELPGTLTTLTEKHEDRLRQLNSNR
jgi:hypothetical protein